MSYRVEWMTAGAEEDEKPFNTDETGTQGPDLLADRARSVGQPVCEEFDSACDWEELLAEAQTALHRETESPSERAEEEQPAESGEAERLAQFNEEERERKIYRARTVTMLRRYMRYSIETGRMPSILGREFFRAKVTSYTVVTFEDRVIFVHDMENCLAKLDEFSQQLIARHILQEHDQAATGRLLGCAEKTVRTWVPVALDLLSEILLEVGLLERRR
jgi:DNA-directed RNA polymerase specialized sigma24 family protein